jgi:SEC-C motif-containing protein
MRARYAAYVIGETDFLFRSWHPRTRPGDLTVPDGLTWTGLRVLRTVEGGAEDDTGAVDFEAGYTSVDGPGVLRERSRFERRAGAWVYVDGDVR